MTVDEDGDNVVTSDISYGEYTVCVGPHKYVAPEDVKRYIANTPEPFQMPIHSFHCPHCGERIALTAVAQKE